MKNSTYAVILETDAPTTDVVGFVTEIYHRVKYYVVTDHRTLLLALEDGGYYVYNLDFLRSYRTCIEPTEDEPQTLQIAGGR